MVIPPILITSLIHFSLKDRENVLFQLGSERVFDICSSEDGGVLSTQCLIWTRHLQGRRPSGRLLPRMLRGPFQSHSVAVQAPLLDHVPLASPVSGRAQVL